MALHMRCSVLLPKERDKQHRTCSSSSSCCLPRPQAERYKALLLKQRDIMVQLTGRLNERDEQILMLQAEIEAYDGHQR